MRNAYLLALPLAAASLQVSAQPQPPCHMDIALQLLERAVQARDDFFFWEDLDEREADAELERYLHRLNGLLAFTDACANSNPDLRVIERQARTLNLQALDIAKARRSPANREAKTR